MRHAIFSDIHGNLDALLHLRDAVVPGLGADSLICLGDVVGRHPSAADLTEALLDGMGAFCIKGNNDRKVALQRERDYAGDARNLRALTRLRTLPEGPLTRGGFALCHSSAAEENRYVLGPDDAAEDFAWMADNGAGVLFYGHTHVPCVIYHHGDPGQARMLAGEALFENEFQLKADGFYMINPGSVGQPRGEPPVPSLALYDDRERRLRFLLLSPDPA